jgi:sulfur carrier protein ThiS adenylyltransferase
MKNLQVNVYITGKNGKFMRQEKIDIIKTKLQNSSIGIAGLGGLGSNAAISLTRAGIGRLVLVDFDKVENSNLDRQYYFNDQIGKFKVDAIEETIRKIDVNIKIEIHKVKLEKGSMDIPFRDVDVVIEALDDAKTKVDFIEEIMNKLPDKSIVAASGVAGYGNCDRIFTKYCGKLCLCYDEYALSSTEDILVAPRVALMANWEANSAIEILLDEEK